MRRLVMALLGLGLAAILIAIPLWHITRSDSSGCVIHNTYPCDPRQYLPFGGIAFALTVFGILSVVAVLAIVLYIGLGRVRAIDARERAARRMSS